VDDRPAPKNKRAAVAVELVVAAARRAGPDGEELLFEQRPGTGRMAGMWQLPTREESGRTGLYPAAFALALELGEPLCTVRHGITHHRIRAVARRARVADEQPVDAPCAWVPELRLAELALTGMTRKVLRDMRRTVGCS
jgi:adenine-specific DNA glycosylase